MDLADRDHGLLRGIDLLGDFHDLRLHHRDALGVAVDRLDHGLQDPGRLRHVGQRHVAERLPDPGGAVGAGVVFGFERLVPAREVAGVLQIGREIVGLDAADIVDVTHLGIASLDDLAVIFDQGFCLLEQRIEAADEVIASAVAPIELHFALGAGKRERVGGFRVLVAGRERGSQHSARGLP